MISALQRNAHNMANLPRPPDHKEDYHRVCEQLKMITQELKDEREEGELVRMELAQALVQNSKSDLEGTNQALEVKIRQLEHENAEIEKVSSDRMKRVGEAKRAAATSEREAAAARSQLEEMEGRTSKAEAIAAQACKERETNQAEMWAQKTRPSVRMTSSRS
eukprot:TRINITY_DN15971_c0_g1_i1.p2 TRINITY_DN15971_c0_g1~~TRINITY_DN15971_c0_g1_i1.p2  ORF type:complete len:163 (+),score=55.65 TRINITY_DN15971_c0_g1_i1:184-672(+)